MMQPISGLISGVAQSPTSISGVKEPPKVQRPEGQTPERSRKPVMDEYAPEQKQEPSGRYWLGKDEDGQPKIYFDDPEQTADQPDKSAEHPDDSKPAREPDAKAPDKKASGDKAESTTCNTDVVDREIERLRKKQEELEQQINSETDSNKIKDLEKKLAQVESELSQKDNDTYRRQHSTFS